MPIITPGMGGTAAIMSLFTELKRRNVVRVGIAYLASAWLLVQIAETLLPVYELPATLIRPLLIILAIGFPVVLILSWAYEITPGGLKLEKDVDRSTSITHHTGKTLDKAIIVVLTIAIAYFAIDKFLLDPVRDSARDESVAQQTRSDVFLERFGDSSIAVLPFVNMSDDDSNEYFSDGISEELLNLLAQIPRLRVISRSTMFQFKGKDIDIPSLAQQLDVSHVLEGSVRKAGNQVRITAQLIDASTDTHLWSNTYDRDLTDIFKIQDEISAEIVASLQDELQVEKSLIPTATPSSNIESYESFLLGRHLMARRNRDDMQLAVDAFENAVALDPNYAVAHAELAIAYGLQKENQYGELTIDESNQLAEPHAELALSLESSLAEAHAAVGFVRWGQNRVDEAMTHFEDAIRLNPSYSNVYVWLSLLLGQQDQFAEEFSMVAMTVRLDPLSLPARNNYVRLLIRHHEFDAARRQLELQQRYLGGNKVLAAKLDRVEFGWASGLLGYLGALQSTPNHQAAQFDFANLLIVVGLEHELIAMREPDHVMLFAMGRNEEAITALRKRIDQDGIEQHDFWMRLLLPNNQEFEEALPLLESAWERNDKQVTFSGGFIIANAISLIQSRRATDRGATVDELIRAMKNYVQDLRAAGFVGDEPFWSIDYFDATVSIYSGELERGRMLAAKAVDQGVFLIPNWNVHKPLSEDPEFAPVWAKQEVNRRRERDKVLAVVCTDNPYADVWVPMESTCSDYAAANVN